MSTADGMSPPATKGHYPKKQQSSDTAPDPNADRADNYPNRWRIERGKQTAKCMVCSFPLAGTKWCVTCENCNKRFCTSCWDGTRVNRYGESFFEGKAQNDEGCWCRFPTKFDPKWEPANEERLARMQVLIAADAEAQRIKAANMEAAEVYGTEQPAAKRQKLELSGARGAVSESHERFNARQDSPAMDSVQQYTPEASATQQRIEHLHNKTTVIIGAGVIGLSIAMELATFARENHTHHDIIVVERRTTYGEEASRQCAGLIYKKGVPAGYEDLLKLSLDSWAKFLSDEHKQIRSVLRYKPGAVVHVELKSKATVGDGATVNPPAWYDAEPHDVFLSDDADIGKISTRKLTKYLYQACKEEGVKFRFRQEVIGIEKTKKGKLEAVEVARVGEPTRCIDLLCHNLIVAAGAGTPGALHEFLPWLAPRETLTNNKQYCDWIRIQGPHVATADKVGLVVRTRSERHPVIMSTQHHEELLVAGIRTRSRHEPPPDDSEEKKERFSEAVTLAANRVNGINESTKLTSGHSIISTSVGKLPLVCKIPAVVVDERFRREEEHPLGIYLAFGFGMYGTTMSRGAAVAIRRMMAGQDSGIWEAFGYP